MQDNDKLQELSEALAQEQQTRQRLEVELKATQTALEAAEQARQEFVSLVTHELRVPMTSIKGYSDLLLKGIMGPLNDMQLNYMGVIRANVERMARMVSDLSDINKIEGERLKMELAVVKVGAVIQEALRPFSSQIEKKSQTVTVTIPDNLPKIKGNQERLIQVMTNLISNAHNYTPENGSINIVAHVERGQVHIITQDNGIGILPEEQPHIFEKFFRASDEETRQIPGNGLALYVSKLLVELHQGQIWFNSTRGKGTSFHITLPVTQAT
ncbi:MAG: hypothetical protein JXA33_29885 [Anaerolineae bacterium]|nr:hypothetical protein [Anaerolineae bacterium]